MYVRNTQKAMVNVHLFCDIKGFSISIQSCLEISWVNLALEFRIFPSAGLSVPYLLGKLDGTTVLGPHGLHFPPWVVARPRDLSACATTKHPWTAVREAPTTGLRCGTCHKTHTHTELESQSCAVCHRVCEFFRKNSKISSYSFVHILPLAWHVKLYLWPHESILSGFEFCLWFCVCVCTLMKG